LVSLVAGQMPHTFPTGSEEFYSKIFLRRDVTSRHVLMVDDQVFFTVAITFFLKGRLTVQSSEIGINYHDCGKNFCLNSLIFSRCLVLIRNRVAHQQFELNNRSHRDGVGSLAHVGDLRIEASCAIVAAERN